MALFCKDPNLMKSRNSAYLKRSGIRDGRIIMFHSYLNTSNLDDRKCHSIKEGDS